MARKPGPAKPAKLKEAKKDEALEEAGSEALSRLSDARDQKSFSQADIEECYYFSAPRRVRTASSHAQSGTPGGDSDELQTSLGFEVSEDFITMIIKSFMPQAGRWAERLGDPFMNEAEKKRLEAAARKDDEKIFQMIRASNFHAELAKQGVPDGAVGVFAMNIEDVGVQFPLRCIGVPIRELEMNLGPDGRIDDRFVIKDTKYRHIPALLPGLLDKLPKEIKDKIDDEPDDEVEIIWAYWRDWSKTKDETWKHVVLVGEEAVHHADLEGEGSCMLVIGRFGATPDFAWPDGPLIKSLPTLREIDEMEAAFIENIDFTIRPPVAADDDGVLGAGLEGGIEPGNVYMRRPRMGAGNSIEKIYEPNPLDAAIFQKVDKERMVKRLHYVDFPEQLGKTPPTLGQWLDEMVEAQEKIGTPGYAFWCEFPYEAFQRFHYLAVARGNIAKADGIRLQAYNPAQRAQENQEVLTATRFIQIGTTAFQETWQVAVDQTQTLRNIQDKLGDKLVVLRSEDDFKKAAPLIASLSGLASGRLQGGVAAAGGPSA